ncbi:MAG: hypothetical protein IKZ60_04870 [Bacteroidales bacterium]|nr:hypothetical protein [Bacteroidales bacterium]
MNKIIIPLSILLLAGCVEERTAGDKHGNMVRLSLTVDCDAPAKSSILVDETRVTDLNVWVYTSSGQLKETHYYDNLSFNSSGSVSFTTDAGGHSHLVVIGNAGRALEAPGSASDTATFGITWSGDASGKMLMIGEGTLSLTSTGMQSAVVLHRAMARIGLRVSLEASLAAAGGVLGGNIRIKSARLCNNPSIVSVTPEAAWSSIRTYKAPDGNGLRDGDRLSDSDITTLYAGGTIYLYGLPNFTDVAYSSRPEEATAYSSYIEMQFDFDSIGNVGQGGVLCRFYANDGDMIGLMGGCSYTCHVTVSNNGASNSWRKDDFRMDAPETFYAGEINDVLMHSRNHDAQSVSFSLSNTPGVQENGTFRIADKIVNGSLQGVQIISKTAGNGTLYCFNSANEMMGSLPLTAIYPEISVSNKTLDVVGTEVQLDLQGLSDIYTNKASEELFSSLYGISSIEPTALVSGLSGDDFIHAGISDKMLFVDKLRWTRSGIERNWTEAVGKTFPYKVTLACGISADFDIGISNSVVSPLRASGFYGEAINVSMVEDPLPAVAALASQNTITASVSTSVPSSFCTPTKSEWQANGWRTWYGGTVFQAGNIADEYVTSWNSSSICWSLPEPAIRAKYGDSIPIFVGKLNPHCGDYVREPVGYYASTIYIPVGVDLYIERVATYKRGLDTWSVCVKGDEFYSTDYLVNFTTCLCFRAHDMQTVLDVEDGHFAYQGRDGGAYYSNYTGIGLNGYAFDSIGSYLETDWDGDLFKNSDFNNGSGPVFFTNSFSYNVCAPYNGSGFGAKGGRHLGIYYYAPYTYQGGHAEIADNNGHVSTKGYVSVEKWSVSSRAFFDWPEEEIIKPFSSGGL